MKLKRIVNGALVKGNTALFQDVQKKLNYWQWKQQNYQIYIFT